MNKMVLGKNIYVKPIFFYTKMYKSSVESVMYYGSGIWRNTKTEYLLLWVILLNNNNNNNNKHSIGAKLQYGDT